MTRSCAEIAAPEPAQAPTEIATAPNTTVYAQQNGPLFGIPLETREAIWVQIFLANDHVAHETLRPRVNHFLELDSDFNTSDYGNYDSCQIDEEIDSNGTTNVVMRTRKELEDAKWSQVPNNGITAILSTSRQIDEEASCVWRRLPQFFWSQRDNFSRMLEEDVWQGLQDITITVNALPDLWSLGTMSSGFLAETLTTPKETDWDALNFFAQWRLVSTSSDFILCQPLDMPL